MLPAKACVLPLARPQGALPPAWRALPTAICSHIPPPIIEDGPEPGGGLFDERGFALTLGAMWFVTRGEDIQVVWHQFLDRYPSIGIQGQPKLLGDPLIRRLKNPKASGL